MTTAQKTGLVREFRIEQVYPSPENDELYAPIDPNREDIRSLAASIGEHGLIEPLVVTIDRYILSGHRRYAAAKLAGLHLIPCRVKDVSREDEPDKFVVLLREYNRQREKSIDEKIREELVTSNPADAYAELVTAREKKSKINGKCITITGKLTRSEISEAKQPMLQAAIKAINGRKQFWPLSDRAIHYSLLNDPPLRHAKKPGSTYNNTLQSYKDLCDLLTRARLTGAIPFNAIADETRPFVHHKGCDDPGEFIRSELSWFLCGYYRNLQRSQPNHIEVLAEKNTLKGVLSPVVEKYCIPATFGRGYCSLPPRVEIAQRYHKSGKSKLILLLVNDFDPEGEDIPHSMARSMRDDFRITDIHAVKVALTKAQAKKYKLPAQMTVKETSSRAGAFSEKHGDTVYELEALEPSVLQKILSDAIDSVMDVNMFNLELAQERNDAAQIRAYRRTAEEMLASIGRASA